MREHVSIDALNIGGMSDLCVLKDGDPPFNFKSDLHIKTAPFEPSYHSRAVDMTYWGPK